MIFELVDKPEELKNIETMASIIWPISYRDILTLAQIEYMLNKYLSVEATQANIKDGYTYVILKDEVNMLGFMAYKIMKDKLFLSKLYIHPKHQKKGYARESIDYLKQFKLPIELTVNKNNKNAYDSYIHMGFKVTDSVVADIGNGFVMDDYVMILKN